MLLAADSDRSRARRFLSRHLAIFTRACEVRNSHAGKFTGPFCSRRAAVSITDDGTGLRRRSRSRYVRDLIAGSTDSTNNSRCSSVLALPPPPPNFNYYPIRYCHSETPLFSSQFRDERINRARAGRLPPIYSPLSFLAL